MASCGPTELQRIVFKYTHEIKASGHLGVTKKKKKKKKKFNSDITGQDYKTMLEHMWQVVKNVRKRKTLSEQNRPNADCS